MNSLNISQVKLEIKANNMKILKLKKTIDIDIEALHKPLLLEDATKLREQFLMNRIEIIEAANVIEDKMRDIIKYYFLGFKHKSAFDEIILIKPWFNFGAKNLVVIELVEKEDLLNKKARQEMEKKLIKLVKLRNLVAHGNLSFSKENSIRLEGFSNKKYSKIFDNKYLNEIEELFEYCNSILDDILKRIVPNTKGYLHPIDK